MSKKWLAAVLVFVLASSLFFGVPETAYATADRENDYPIILVHGFSGWGRDELWGYKYWGGGKDDIQEDLNARGFNCRTAAVGPLSSSWDRACELYAQLQGTTTDYGKAHSDKFGHDRFGRSYAEPLVPRWGQLDDQGRIKKIHLITHSHGGQTGRLLIHLMEYGDPEEKLATDSEELSPLFKGGKQWVASQTLVAAPCDGTTLEPLVIKYIPPAQQLVALAAAIFGASDQHFYDFKLEQWGMKRWSEESMGSYLKRVVKSSLWIDTKDASPWDLSPEGAREFNGRTKASPNVYYFTLAGEATEEKPETGYQVPESDMYIPFKLFGYLMGKYTHDGAGGRVSVDKSWWQNDGVINTNSADGPTIYPGGSVPETIVINDGKPKKGVFNYLGLLEHVDHFDIVGIPTLTPEMKSFYQKQAAFLYSLPGESPKTPKTIDPIIK